MIRKFSLFFCTGFGVGFFPFFPGTIASLVILPFVWFVKINFPLEILIFGIALYYVFSLFLLKTVLLNIKDKDPKYIVADEHIGQSIALIFCDQKVLDYLVSFILFRFFDVVKPFPINIVDKNMKNACGVILDDILAGIFVCVIIAYVF